MRAKSIGLAAAALRCVNIEQQMTIDPRIWLVAFMEGFSTLAVEVVAIRLAIPVAGSSMTLTGVMLGVVLFALSAGYWRGGELSSRWDNRRTRAALTRNLLLAGAIYAAVSFPLESLLLEKILEADAGLGLSIGLMACVLFVLPVYLASQTVPMLAELTNSEGKAGKASGKVLFFSTIGSVAGGILTPIFLFPYLGVRASTYVICALLVTAAGLMAMGRVQPVKIVVAVVLVVAAVSAGRFVPRPTNERYAFDSAHQSIRILEEPADGGRVQRVLTMNGSRASGIYADTGETSFIYVREAARELAAAGSGRVLVIGAAGFTFPRDAAGLPFVKRIDAVDVDPVVREIAERHFLQRPLPAKVRFLPLSARYALHKLRRDGERYGFTFLDGYTGKGIPEELLTVEFFSDVRAISEHVAANVIMDQEVESAFARNVLASFREAFGRVWIKHVRLADEDLTNIMVTNGPVAGSLEWTGAGRLYTDNRNTADRDHVELVWGSGE
jgi:spermidine synthase